ncbi:MAG: nitrogen fixation protein NifH [Anaerolineales bacterium]
MGWKDVLHADPTPWLLEEEAPGVRYLALRDLFDRPETDLELETARVEAHRSGPIAVILDAMSSEGYWVEPGPGYNPKYRSSVWSLIMLAQLGARLDQDARIARACEYMLDHSLTSAGQFTITGAPSGTVDCLQGNLCWALVELGCRDARLDLAYEWMARTVTGEGLASNQERDAPLRYYAGKCGPGFCCGGNNKLPCAWGAVKVMMAFSVRPAGVQGALIDQAIERGVDFLLGTDPAGAAYPTGYASKPSGNWWKFGFPVFYITDLLQNLEALLGLSLRKDSRLERALAVVVEKQDDEGRWPLEFSYSGKTWVDFGDKRKPNKWVTLRALRLLKAAL